MAACLPEQFCIAELCQPGPRSRGRARPDRPDSRGVLQVGLGSGRPRRGSRPRPGGGRGARSGSRTRRVLAGDRADPGPLDHREACIGLVARARKDRAGRCRRERARDAPCRSEHAYGRAVHRLGETAAQCAPGRKPVGTGGRALTPTDIRGSRMGPGRTSGPHRVRADPASLTRSHRQISRRPSRQRRGGLAGCGRGLARAGAGRRRRTCGGGAVLGGRGGPLMAVRVRFVASLASAAVPTASAVMGLRRA